MFKWTHTVVRILVPKADLPDKPKLTWAERKELRRNRPERTEWGVRFYGRKPGKKRFQTYDSETQARQAATQYRNHGYGWYDAEVMHLPLGAPRWEVHPEGNGH